MGLLTRLICHLALLRTLSLVTAQSVGPASSPQTLSAGDSDQIQFSPATGPSGGQPRIVINLVNLTAAASSKLSGQNERIKGTPLLVNPGDNSSAITSNDIPVILCDEAPGFIQPVQTLQNAIEASVSAIILYSNTSNYCRLTPGPGVPSDYIVYSMVNSHDWQQILNAPSQNTPLAPASSNLGTWQIAKKSTLDNSTMSSGTNYSPGGPSPSTAVAMIILYSITGVITALFLVIIITGAVRAHRHPERYGPRNALGRPRQSRARGLARAMLDTLPIVKFGEREEPKPNDVELANATTGETRQVSDSNPATASTSQETADAHIAEPNATAGAEESESADKDGAVAAATRSSPEPPTSTTDQDALGCSICTEDFERGQDVRVLPCNHSFHPACIDPWLLNVSGTCPLCRIDLRPTTSHTSTTEGNHLSPDSASGGSNPQLPPPLDTDSAEHATSHRASRRLSGFWEILNPRRMQEASPQERIAALRRVREQRRGTVTAVEEAETRRRRRLTARLGETFGVRTRPRDGSPELSPRIEGSEDAAVEGARSESEAPAANSSTSTAAAVPAITITTSTGAEASSSEQHQREEHRS